MVQQQLYKSMFVRNRSNSLTSVEASKYCDKSVQYNEQDSKLTRELLSDSVIE